MSGKGGRSGFGSDRCTAGNEAGRYKHGQRVKPDRSYDRLPPPIDRASSAPSTVTVTVRPAIRSIPVGTLSIAMRTGTRWARRTQLKVGLTLARRLPAAVVRSRSSIRSEEHTSDVQSL